MLYIVFHIIQNIFKKFFIYISWEYNRFTGKEECINLVIDFYNFSFSQFGVYAIVLLMIIFSASWLPCTGSEKSSLCCSSCDNEFLCRTLGVLCEWLLRVFNALIPSVA